MENALAKLVTMKAQFGGLFAAMQGMMGASGSSMGSDEDMFSRLESMKQLIEVSVVILLSSVLFYLHPFPPLPSSILPFPTHYSSFSPVVLVDLLCSALLVHFLPHAWST
eukprot:765007-Hanusia_phi.AAC.1